MDAVRRKPLRLRDVLLVLGVSAFFITATVFPYVRRKASEDLAVRKLREEEQ